MAKYQMNCDDHFMVQSDSKDEVINMAAMHIMTMHPKEKLSKNDVAMKVEKM